MLVGIINSFARIDDTDVFTHLKNWSTSKDPILATLSNNLLNRNLFKIEIQNMPFDQEKVEVKRKEFVKRFSINSDDVEYFIFTGSISNNAYSPSDEKINILLKDGSIADIADASDMLNISVLSQVVKKYFLCYPKDSFEYNY